jgi:multiple sugar transport system substrate-binding protein
MTGKRISRRNFLHFSAATTVGALLAGCATATAPAAGGGSEAAPAADAITLRLWHWDNFMSEPWAAEGKLFTEAHPNVNVVVEITGWDEYAQKLAASIAGGSPSDVTGAISEFFTTLAGNNQLSDLGPYIERDNYDIEDWHPGNLSQNSWNDVLLSLPYTADGMWWFYQIETFQEKGLKTPYEYWKEGNWTWDTAAELAAQLTSGEGIEKVFGSGLINYGSPFEIQPYMASGGGEFFDSAYTKAVINEAPASNAYQWAYNMRQFAPGAEDADSSAPQSGRVMQWLDWSPYYQVYLDQMPFKYSVAPPPASPDSNTHVFCGDAPGFGILNGVAAPDESWAFIAHLMSKEALERVFLLTNAEPPRMSMATDVELWRKNTKLPEPEIAYELTAARFEAFYNTPKVSNWLEMWQAHNEELSLAWSDSVTLQVALDTAVDRINGLISEAEIDQDQLYWTGA